MQFLFRGHRIGGRGCAFLRLLGKREEKVQMGTFVNFTGDMSVPEEEMELFNRYMQKILDIGGIMDLSRVELDLMRFPAGTG